MKLPRATPPEVPVVQKVIGPPAVPISRGLPAVAPVVVTVIRPTDFKVSPLPDADELTLACTEIVPEDSTVVEKDCM